MKDLKKLMGKDDGNDNMKKDAKLSVLKELRQMAMGMMGDDVKNGMMKKVTVAAPSKEGLQEGLEKAEELIDDSDLQSESEEEHDEDDLSKYSSEELDAKIAELQAAKAKLQS